MNQVQQLLDTLKYFTLPPIDISLQYQNPEPWIVQQLQQINFKMGKITEKLNQLKQQAHLLNTTQCQQLQQILQLLFFCGVPGPYFITPFRDEIWSSTKKYLKSKYPGVGSGKSIRSFRHFFAPTDIFNIMALLPKQFYEYTKMSVQEFEKLHEQIKDKIEKPKNGKIQTKSFNKYKSATRLFLVLAYLVKGRAMNDWIGDFRATYNYLRSELQHIIPILDRQLEKEINPSFPKELVDPIFRTCGSFDNTHLAIIHDQCLQRLYYRHDKGHALIFQIGADYIGEIHSVSGPYFGSMNDNNVLFHSNVRWIYLKLRFLVDGGYGFPDSARMRLYQVWR